MQKVGLLYNPRVEISRPLAEEIAAWLEQQGVATWMYATNGNPPSDAKPEESDLLITLGGDGTILRAIPFIAPLGIPLIGINLGRVGFLTECIPDDWTDMLERTLSGDGEVEERMMLKVTEFREGASIHHDAGLNDVVLSRGALARTVRLDAYIDGAFMTRYVADGLIVATATGSTAYSYAVGGPILPPWIENLLLVPVAPHLSLDRPLVLDATSVIELTVQTQTPGMLTLDGRLVGKLMDGDRVRIERSPLVARFLRLRSKSDFYKTLVTRLTPRNGAC